MSHYQPTLITFYIFCAGSRKIKKYSNIRDLFLISHLSKRDFTHYARPSVRLLYVVISHTGQISQTN